MKTNPVPKDVLALSAEIRTRCATIEQHRADIERMKAAATEADRLNAEMEELSQKRAEHKAMALVAGKPADLEELDRKQDELERATRQAREDGVAAALAVTMLETRIIEIQTEITQIKEDRRAKTVEWLAARHEAAIDQWMAALTALGPIFAERLAVEAARRCLVPNPNYGDDPFKKAKNEVDALRRLSGRSTFKEAPYNNGYWVPPPIGWLDEQEYGKPERDQLFAALSDAGVL